MRDLPDWSDLLSQPSGTSLPLIAIPMSQAYDGCAWELQQISDGSALGNNLWKQLKKEKRKKKKKKNNDHFEWLQSGSGRPAAIS